MARLTFAETLRIAVTICMGMIAALLALNIALHSLGPSVVLIPSSQMTTVALVELFGLAVIMSLKTQLGSRSKK
jgi:hypothetical protein